MIENGDYKIEIESRLTTIEVKLNEVMENHLPHLEAKVDRITWLLVTTLITALVSLVFKFIQ